MQYTGHPVMVVVVVVAGAAEADTKQALTGRVARVSNKDLIWPVFINKAPN